MKGENPHSRVLSVKVAKLIGNELEKSGALHLKLEVPFE